MGNYGLCYNDKPAGIIPYTNPQGSILVQFAESEMYPAFRSGCGQKTAGLGSWAVGRH